MREMCVILYRQSRTLGIVTLRFLQNVIVSNTIENNRMQDSFSASTPFVLFFCFE